jgi:2-polyprenyl-3-methyl-5-hydroxy-6-metoxy-1,4-benzoquinol methylase
MNHYKEKVIEAYSGGNEVNRALNVGQYGLEFHYTKKILDSCISSEMDIVEIGCGGGYYGIHYACRCRSYLGIDLSPVNIEVFKRQIAELRLDNVRAQIGDATDLADIPDDSFDVVLCLGPLYHLNQEDRQKCILECKRICKTGGLIAMAFINKTGAIAKFGIGVGWDKVFTPRIDEYVLHAGKDDARPDVFFYTMPEEMEKSVNSAGLKIITSAGLDFLIFEKEIEGMSDEQRKVLFHFMDILNASPSCTGLANHAMLICRK